MRRRKTDLKKNIRTKEIWSLVRQGLTKADLLMILGLRLVSFLLIFVLEFISVWHFAYISPPIWFDIYKFISIVLQVYLKRAVTLFESFANNQATRARGSFLKNIYQYIYLYIWFMCPFFTGCFSCLVYSLDNIHLDSICLWLQRSGKGKTLREKLICLWSINEKT